MLLVLLVLCFAAGAGPHGRLSKSKVVVSFVESRHGSLLSNTEYVLGEQYQIGPSFLLRERERACAGTIAHMTSSLYNVLQIVPTDCAHAFGFHV